MSQSEALVNNNHRDGEDSIGFSRTADTLSIGTSFMDSSRFGRSVFAMNKKPSITFSALWKVVLAVIGIVLVSVVIWAATSGGSSKLTGKNNVGNDDPATSQQQSVHIDDYQSEKITKLENDVKYLQKRMDRLTNTVNGHISDYNAHGGISSNPSTGSGSAGINSGVNANLVAALRSQVDQLKALTEQQKKRLDKLVSNLANPGTINTAGQSSSPGSTLGTATEQLTANLKVHGQMLTEQMEQIADVNARTNVMRDEVTKLNAWKQSIDHQLSTLSTTAANNQAIAQPSGNAAPGVASQLAAIRSELDQVKTNMKIDTPRSCEEYFRTGMTTSGIYMIDPDGTNIGEPPFAVFCDAVKKVTRITHNQMAKVAIPICENANCYNLSITYAPSMDQMISLLDVSESCSQMIQFDCYLSKLSKIGSWIDRHGQRQTYFDGSHYGENVCKCSTTNPNSCFSRSDTNMCNCDQKDPVSRQDAGFITNKTALPIVQFSYGLMYLSSQKAEVTIGALECKGRVVSSLSGGSCQALKMQGKSTGYYILDTSNGTSEFEGDIGRPILHVSQCNMSLGVSDPNFQTDLGYITLYTGKVYIIADITQHHSITRGDPIPFDKIVKDRTGSFFLSNSTFVAPWSGTFTFMKHHFRCTSSDRDMYGYINGNDHDYFEIKTIETGQTLQRGQTVVITRRDSSITLGCDEFDPCRVTIKGEEF